MKRTHNYLKSLQQFKIHEQYSNLCVNFTHQSDGWQCDLIKLLWNSRIPNAPITSLLPRPSQLVIRRAKLTLTTLPTSLSISSSDENILLCSETRKSNFHVNDDDNEWVSERYSKFMSQHDRNVSRRNVCLLSAFCFVIFLRSPSGLEERNVYPLIHHQQHDNVMNYNILLLSFCFFHRNRTLLPLL